jgi:hypothetical protein
MTKLPDLTVLNWRGFNHIEQEKKNFHADWIELEWTGLGLNGIDWAELGWTGLC